MSGKYRPHDVIREDRPDGAVVLRARVELGEVAARTTDWLEHWADRTPDAVFLAERSGDGWRELSYAGARAQARAMAVGLLDMGLGPTRPVLVISGNSVAHGLLAMACHYAGVPVVPVAEQYAAIPAARGQLDQIARLVRPGAVFAEDGFALGDVLDRDSLAAARPLMVHGPGRRLDDLARVGGDLRGVDVGPDSVAKILMTSGSTSAPKGVLTTHRMMCTNQAQIAACLPFLHARPPVLVDWLPWNHVFGGSHNFNMVLAHGGALYIDGGKPVPALIGKTIENNRIKRGTISFNVPVGFAALRDAMRDDAGFARAFFEDLDMLFYAGASLPQDVWSDLWAMAEAAGRAPFFTSSWGLTETAPAALLQHEPTDRSGVVGVPVPGVEVKLLPEGERFEVRVRGPSIFTGYLGAPDKTAEAFDAEGFFRTGDAMAFVDPDNPDAGLRFDGRIAEDFKLTTGIWVRAATLRLEVLGALKALAQDVIVTGEGRSEVGVLIVPTPALRDGAQEVDGALLVDPARLAPLAGFTGGSASRIAGALVLAEPPSIAEGEITAKGNLNFAKIKARRAALVDRLHAGGDGAILMGKS